MSFELFFDLVVDLNDLVISRDYEIYLDTFFCTELVGDLIGLGEFLSLEISGELHYSITGICLGDLFVEGSLGDTFFKGDFDLNNLSLLSCYKVFNLLPILFSSIL